METEMKKYFSVLLMFSYAAATLAATPLSMDISAGYSYDDNVTRAELDRDIEKDNILNVDGSIAYKLPVNNISYFSLKGTLDVNQYLDFTRLSNTRLGIHGSYHIRPGSGYTAIRYLALLSYERRLYDSDQRDGSATEIELGLRKRLTDLLALRAGYIRQDISADSKVFDAENNRLYLDLEYKLTAKNNLYATIGYVDGDVVSTAVATAKIVQASSAIARDDAFLDLVPPRWAYKLGAKTTSIRVGDNYAIGSRQAIDGSLLYYDSAADGDNDYSGLILNLYYTYRF